MSAKTVFKQPSKWNYLVDESIPLTWKYTWSQLKVAVPLLATSAALLVELILLRAWVDDHLDTRAWTMALISPLILGLMLFLMVELGFWIQHRTERRLTLTRRVAQFSHSKYPARWNNVVECRFEPIQGKPDLTRFSLTYRWDRKGQVRRTWAVILSSALEVDRLRAELAARREQGFAFPVEDGQESQPPAVRSPPKMKRMWFLSLAFFFFVHGWGLLTASMISPDAQPKPARQGQTSESKRPFRQLIRRHFASNTSFRAFLGITGGTLTGASVFLFFVSHRAGRNGVVVPECLKQTEQDSL